jgi:hypothetical protein
MTHPSPCNDIAERAVSDTRRWLERAVIGLNLCPFAKAVLVKRQIHFTASLAVDPADLLDELGRELDELMACPQEQRDTTLLIAPCCLRDFMDFHAFLPRARRELRSRRLEGVIQLADFHPDYQFAGTQESDITNCTNRAPYPTLHLLREASIERAVRAFPDAADIYEANKRTLLGLGAQGWRELDVGPSR